jgi:hypothetical protein
MANSHEDLEALLRVSHETFIGDKTASDIPCRDIRNTPMFSVSISIFETIK